MRRRSHNIEPFRPRTSAKWRVDERLLNRQIAARAALPENSVKRLIEDQPDFGEPVDFERLPV